MEKWYMNDNLSIVRTPGVYSKSYHTFTDGGV